MHILQCVCVPQIYVHIKNANKTHRFIVCLIHYFKTIKSDIKHISRRINISVNSLICLLLLLFIVSVCYNDEGRILIKTNKKKRQKRRKP